MTCCPSRSRLLGTEVFPADYYFNQQWALNNTGQLFYWIAWIDGDLCLYVGTPDADIDAPEAWAISPSGLGVKVAVADSGVDYAHPDLASHYAGGADFVNNDSDPMDDHGHGTHVAGTIAASMNTPTGDPAKEEGVVGVAPDASLGGPDFSQSTSDAVQDAWNAGVVIVAAAGNDGSTNFSYPAAYDHVVSVGAFDEDHKRASFSNYGSWVDLSAPGNVIISTYPLSACGGGSTVPGDTGCYAWNSGTWRRRTCRVPPRSSGAEATSPATSRW